MYFPKVVCASQIYIAIKNYFENIRGLFDTSVFTSYVCSYQHSEIVLKNYSTSRISCKIRDGVS